MDSLLLWLVRAVKYKKIRQLIAKLVLNRFSYSLIFIVGLYYVFYILSPWISIVDTSILISNPRALMIGNAALLLIMILWPLPYDNEKLSNFADSPLANQLLFINKKENEGKSQENEQKGAEGKLNQPVKENGGKTDIEEVYIDIEDVEDLSNKSKCAINHFRNFWLATIIIWFSFFIVTLISEFLGPEHFPISLQRSLINLLNIASTATFLACYYIVAQRTYIINNNSGTDDIRYKLKLPASYRFYVVILGLIAIVDFIAPYHIAESLITNYYIIISLLIGVTSGIVFALFISRIDSMFIRNSDWLIALAFLYSFLFVVYPIIFAHNGGFIGNPDNSSVFLRDTMIFIYHMSFVLKGLFVFLLTWLFSQGRMALYFMKMNISIAHTKATSKHIFALLSPPTETKWIENKLEEFSK